MSSYLVAPAARTDVAEIWNYYADTLENLELADRIYGEITEAFDCIALRPGLGHFRGDLAQEPLRFWRVRNYLIVYRSERLPVEIVRVFHGARDVQTLLKDESPE